MQHSEIASENNRAVGPLMLLAALMLGALVGFGFAPYAALPGLGLVLFAYGFTALALLFGAPRLKWHADGWALLMAALGLILCYGLYDNGQMRLLNVPVAALMLLMALARLTGLQQASLFEAGSLIHTLWLAVKAPFAYIGKAFRMFRRQAGADRTGRRDLLLGLLLTVPLLAVIGLLLASADGVFQSLLRSLTGALTGPRLEESLQQLMISLVIGLGCFSLLYGLSRGEAAAPAAKERVGLPALSLSVLLVAVNLLYGVFLAIQFAYLFGGAAHAAMAGGWAQYARRGFFELVAVALINLGLCLYCRLQWPGQRLLRWLCGLLVLMTMLLLASALRRMGLYIQAFGLSLLRLLTLWGIAVIFLALLLLAVQLIRPQFRILPMLTCLTLTSYVALNLLSPAGLVANYNVSAYLDGRLSQLDTSYLKELGSDSLPAFQRLAAADDALGRDGLLHLKGQDPQPWYALSLSELHRQQAKAPSGQD